jgi:hypothetical protein
LAPSLVSTTYVPDTDAPELEAILNHIVASRARTVLASAALAAVLIIGPAAPILTTRSLAAEHFVVVTKVKKGFHFVKLYGSSPYICTPSGFGQKARCYLRSV